MKSVLKSAIFFTLASSALALSGCASFKAAAPGDPLEPINRGVFSFNNTFDHYLFKPIAKGYDAAVPAPVVVAPVVETRNVQIGLEISC